MKIDDIIDNYPNISLTVTSKELREFAMSVAQETCKVMEGKLISQDELQCVTSKQACELLQVAPATIWRWNQDRYLIPIKVGCSTRYRMKDIQRLLVSEKVKL